MNEHSKTLKFTHEYAQQLLRGTRSYTVRVGDKGYQIGERVQAIDKVNPIEPASWRMCGMLTITSKYIFRLDEVPHELYGLIGEGIDSAQDLRVFLERFYKNLTADTVVVLLGFSFQPTSDTTLNPQYTQTKTDRIEETVVLYADGGSRGNPGPSAAGYVIKNDRGDLLHTWNKYLGITTNNQAEYHGLIAAFEWCKQHGVRDVAVRLDSLLVINQMKGIFRVKNRDLWTLHEYAKKLAEEFRDVSFTHVPRELNKDADAEVNKALDAIKDQDVVQ